MFFEMHSEEGQKIQGGNKFEQDKIIFIMIP